ncbi:MAG TPA: 50S ribosomal protein L11 methyltransferase [Gemmatimonadales bacterium]|nr:50S ribosomal protein L11 methyltransferase [Gemmatimonadales bacterium]
MSWHAVSVRADPAVRDAVAEWLVRRTGQAVEERADGTLVSFALELSEAQALIRDLEAKHGPAVAASHGEVPEVDWTTAWRAGLAPRRSGRVVLAPSWVPYEAQDGEVVVVVDPEAAFGSGEHGSTRVALRLLEAWLKPGDTLLDLGSGSGVLAIAGAKLGARLAVGIELDPDALPVAERNAARNWVSDRVRFLEGDAGTLAPLLRPADLVVCNVLRTVNEALLPAVHRALRPGGTAIFSGMEQAEATEFRAPLLAGGFTILREALDEGWWGVAAERA